MLETGWKAWTDNQLKLVLIPSQDQTKVLRLTSKILAGMKTVYIMIVFSVLLNWIEWDAEVVYEE